MVHTLSPAQLKSIETTERVTSCFSVVGTMFIFVTLLSSPNFRKPINRLVFYASWGNLLCNVATLMSESPIRKGPNSPLCQFQAFFIQMFVPADALWNLAMAINVYLSLFKKYNAADLKALEWRYLLMCYGCPFLVAFIYIFIDTESHGKMYGSAVLWCWITDEWDFIRIATCYAPAWICIVAAFGIYILAGRELFKKRQQLRAFRIPMDPVAFDGFTDKSDNSKYKVTNEYQVTSEVVGNLPSAVSDKAHIPTSDKSSHSSRTYTVNISGNQPRVSGCQNSASHRNRAAMEANGPAFAYTKVACLYLVSLLVTWVPSSLNRVYTLIHPGSVSVEFAYAGAIVLSLMGFWNSVIYIVTSHRACRAMFLRIFGRRDDREMSLESNDDREDMDRRVMGRGSYGESLEVMARQRELV